MCLCEQGWGGAIGKEREEEREESKTLFATRATGTEVERKKEKKTVIGKHRLEEVEEEESEEEEEQAKEKKKKKKKEKKSGRKKNAHNAVISVFDLPISLWGYYMGSRCGHRLHTRSIQCWCVCSDSVRMPVWVFEGEAGFILPALLFRWRSRADPWPFHGSPRQTPWREPRLFMDGFPFNFRQDRSVSLYRFASLRPDPLLRVHRLSTRLSATLPRAHFNAAPPPTRLIRIWVLFVGRGCAIGASPR